MRKAKTLKLGLILLALGLPLLFNQCGKVAFEVSPAEKAQAYGNLVSLSSIKIENGAPYTRNLGVGLTLYSPQAVQMKISNQADCSDGTWEAFSPAKAWTLSHSDAQVSVFALYKDIYDNVSNCVSASIVHDDIAPQLTFAQAANLITNSAALNISWTASDNLSGIATTQCVDSQGATSSCTSSLLNAAQGDGTKTFTVKLQDNAGNSSSFNYSWLLDTKPPTVLINSQPPLKTKMGSGAFTFSATDQGGSGVKAYYCRIEPAVAAPCTSPFNFSGLADGTYTFDVYATDVAGNSSTPVSATWTIISKAPGLAFTSTPPPISNSGSAPSCICWHGSQPAHRFFPVPTG